MAVELTTADVETLEPGDFLNDKIMDFYLKWVSLCDSLEGVREGEAVLSLLHLVKYYCLTDFPLNYQWQANGGFTLCDNGDCLIVDYFLP